MTKNNDSKHDLLIEFSDLLSAVKLPDTIQGKKLAELIRRAQNETKAWELWRNDAISGRDLLYDSGREQHMREKMAELAKQNHIVFLLAPDGSKHPHVEEVTKADGDILEVMRWLIVVVCDHACPERCTGNDLKMWRRANELVGTPIPVEWTEHDVAVADHEGWGIFNANTNPTIQRIDGDPTFDTDGDALAFVSRLSHAGSDMHRRALLKCGSTPR